MFVRTFDFELSLLIFLKLGLVDVKLATFVFKAWLTQLPEELKFFSYGNTLADFGTIG